MQKRKLISEGWEVFSKIIPKNAPEIQRKEMKAAFYSGAAITYEKLIAGLTSGDEPENENMQLLLDLHIEIMEFMEKLKGTK